MAVGFVLIGVEPQHEREVQARLMKVEAETYDRIGEVVVSKIRTIPGVRATKTLAKMTF